MKTFSNIIESFMMRDTEQLSTTKNNTFIPLFFGKIHHKTTPQKHQQNTNRERYE
jgi:hypothetical protein